MAFPDWGVKGILAKVDTGARTSALHVENVEHLGDESVEFDVVRSRKYPDRRTRVRAPIKRTTTIRSSMGRTQERIVVEARVQLAGVDKVIELSLVSRKRMICRMLIGRTALADDFYVDASINRSKVKK